jgi:hypothetical protein
VREQQIMRAMIDAETWTWVSGQIACLRVGLIFSFPE